MSQTCKGICTRYTEKGAYNGPMAKSLNARCSICQYSISTENLRCSCCGGKYRMRPRLGARRQWA